MALGFIFILKFRAADDCGAVAKDFTPFCELVCGRIIPAAEKAFSAFEKLQFSTQRGIVN